MDPPFTSYYGWNFETFPCGWMPGVIEVPSGNALQSVSDPNPSWAIPEETVHPDPDELEILPKAVGITLGKNVLDITL
jgi:hypothetical protein